VVLFAVKRFNESLTKVLAEMKDNDEYVEK
jgi:hypothetical protein